MHPLQRKRRLVLVDTCPYVQEVCRQRFGSPVADLSSTTQWRYGTRGSLAIEIADSPGKKQGEWFDHEQKFGGSDPQSLLIEHEGMSAEEARDFLVSCGVRIDAPAAKRPKPRIVATYDYKDETGKLLFQVVRMDPKDFRQRRPDAKGGWLWSVKGVRMVPYRLPELIASTGRIYIVEGEKDADNLTSIGCTATTNAGGVNKWLPSYNRYFAGRDVILICDNDDAGREHMARISAELTPVTASVRTITLEGLPLKGDVSDWIDGGGTAATLDAMCANGHFTASAIVIPPSKVSDTSAEAVPAVIPDWTAKLQLFDSGEPKPILDNVCIALESDARTRSMLAFDEFAQHIVAVEPPPWIKKNGHWDDPVWSDADDISITRFFQQHGLHVAVATVHDAIVHVARKRTFHPVRDYLDSLVWDKVPRLDTWLTYYLGADDLPLHRAVGAAWPVSAIARVRDPGCKADCALFLVGLQGIMKSSVFRVLGGRWFSDDIGDLGSKDSAMALLGRWIFELADLEQFARADVRRIKAFMSRVEDRYRPPYGRNMVENKRQCVFGGTTNEDEFLRDHTGDRRFWPVNVVSVDIDSLIRDRDQLWAEASERYKNGALWYLDKQQSRDARKAQDQHSETDVWDDLLAEHFASRIMVPITRCTIADLLTQVINLPKDKWGRSEQMRVARFLKKRGWVRKFEQRTKTWFYKLPSPDETSSDDEA